jgi:hypothetical protein
MAMNGCGEEAGIFQDLYMAELGELSNTLFLFLIRLFALGKTFVIKPPTGFQRCHQGFLLSFIRVDAVSKSFEHIRMLIIEQIC